MTEAHQPPADSSAPESEHNSAKTTARERSPYAEAPRLPEGESLSPEEIIPSASFEQGLEVEVGPGRGTFLIERAQRFPELRILGLEIRLKWASLVDQKVASLGLSDRCRVLAEDIRLALPRLATGSCTKIFVHFPDPWWKKRHAKRRLANGGVMDQVARILRPGGELYIQTDVWGTAKAYRDAVAEHAQLEPFGDEEGNPVLAENPYGAQSPREKRSIADGMPIVRLRYRRVSQDS